MEKPKMVLIIDEAHLLFADAPKSLLDQMEMVIKLIRSKGVGIFFCTQNPIDIPPSILAQLGLKVQHALRAFTANDRDAIRKASQNFPESTYYAVEDDLTTLGIGEAFVTCLDERGVPTPLVHTMVLPPQSRMDTLTPVELSGLLSISPLVPKYNRDVDRESADELIAKRISEKLAAAQAEVARIEAERISTEPSMLGDIGGGIGKSILKSLGGELGRSVGKSLGGGRIGANIGGQVVRGLLGALFGGK
jgi:DNA helicase HerA-like ATPase